MPQAGAAPNYGSSSSSNGPSAKCVPLVPALLSIVSLDIVASSIKIADRGREVVYFHVRVHVSRSLPPEDPRQALLGGNVPMTWIVEKTWTELQALDQAIRAKNSRSALRKVPGLPDKNLFKDHAPLRVDQRKVSRLSLE
jgi:RalA-binding protein 1